MILLVCFCLLLINDWAVISLPISAGRTSLVPVKLNLQPWGGKNGSSTIQNNRKARTRPEFFEKVLKLKSNAPFMFSLDKWYAVRNSGLFTNITARSIVSDDGVCLVVNGTELPSRSIAPELGFTASLENPELSGGIMYKDRNFRGLGEYLEVLVSKKEGTEEAVRNMPIDMKFSWRESFLGKSDALTADFEEQNLYLVGRNMIPSEMKQFPPLSTIDKFGGRIHARLRSMQVKALGVLIPKLSGNESQPTISARYTLNPYQRTIGFFDDIMGLTSDKLVYSGALTSIKLLHEDGQSLEAWYDGGFLRLVDSPLNPTKGFQQIGFRSNYPYMPSFLSTNFLAKLSVGAKRAWGPACLPFYHFSSMSDWSTARGFPSNEAMAVGEETGFNHASSLCSIKMDAYLSKFLPFGTIGAFADNAFYGNNGENNVKLFSSVGLSFRWQGFRLDAALPVTHSSLFSNKNPSGATRSMKFSLGLDIGD